MPYYAFASQTPVFIQQSRRHVPQAFILGIGKKLVVCSFEFDTDTELVAVFLALKTGFTGMPCLEVERYVLGNIPGAIDKQVCRDLQARDLFEVRMGTWLQAVGE